MENKFKGTPTTVNMKIKIFRGKLKEIVFIPCQKQDRINFLMSYTSYTASDKSFDRRK